MSVSTRLRKNARRSLRRAEEDGLTCVLAGPEEADQAARRLITLQREMWAGRDIDQEHLTQKFESHLVAATKRLTVCGLGGVYEFWRDGKVVASHLLLFGRDFVADYLVGAKHEALLRYQMHSLYAWNSIMVARSRGSARVDLLQGEEPYKLQWTSKVITVKRVILSRSLASWALYVSYHALRSRARRYANSENTPRWVKSAVERYRTLRRKVTLC